MLGKRTDSLMILFLKFPVSGRQPVVLYTPFPSRVPFVVSVRRESQQKTWRLGWVYVSFCIPIRGSFSLFCELHIFIIVLFVWRKWLIVYYWLDNTWLHVCQIALHWFLFCWNLNHPQPQGTTFCVKGNTCKGAPTAMFSLSEVQLLQGWQAGLAFL